VDNRTAEAVIFWVFASFGTVIISWLVLRSRAPVGPKLTLTGVVVAVAALWYGLVTGVPNTQGVSLQMGNPALAEVALKLAAVLVLGGTVICLLPQPPSIPPERPQNVPPSV
jgi:hypothetical protein